MTELETQLLASLKRSGQQFKEEQGALRTMFERTLKENETLSTQVTSLAKQVTTLSEQVTALSRRLPK